MSFYFLIRQLESRTDYIILGEVHKPTGNKKTTCKGKYDTMIYLLKNSFLHMFTKNLSELFLKKNLIKKCTI